MRETYPLLRIVLVLMVFSSGLQAQIKGTVKDSGEKPVPGATVTLLNTGSKILYHTFSNSEGGFAFSLPDTARPENIRRIEVRAFGWVTQGRAFHPDILYYPFVMEVAVHQLEELKVTARVSQKGDTTSYQVDAFQGREDRSIGDVIARLPDMSVSDDGTVRYKDKEIKGLYIHGDDLMQGRYGLATRAITPDKIKSIQVIERFQPIKVLKHRVISNDVAVNLVLKDENALKLSGSAVAGAGIPGLLNAHVTPMLFNKKIKTLNVAKYNNSGESYPTGNFKDLLDDAAISNPGLPEKYINRNRSGLISANYLYNFKDTLQVRAHAQYVTDRRDLGYSSYNRNYLVGDTVIFLEQQQVSRKPRLFSASLAFERNKSSQYLKNTTEIKTGSGNSRSSLDFNGSAFDQELNVKDRSLSNNLHLIPFSKGRNTYNIQWQTSWRQRPQELQVFTGIDSAMLNHGQPYQAVFQQVEKETFQNHLFSEYFINDRKRLKKSLTAGVESEWETLGSGITLEQADGRLLPYDGDAGNHLKWQKHRPYLSGAFVLENRKIKGSLHLPLSYQAIRYRQQEYGLDEQSGKIIFNPSFSLRYFLNSNNYFHASYALSNGFGTINQVYRGVILTNYKSIGSNNSDLQETQQHQAGLSYTYRDAISMFDFTAGSSYAHNRVNAIYATEYRENIVRTILLPYRNSYTVTTWNASVSKYFYPIKSKVEISPVYSRSYSNLFVNEQFLPYRNENLGLKLNAGLQLTSYLSVNYTGSANRITGSTDGSETSTFENRFTTYSHRYSLALTPRLPLNVIVQAQQQINGSGGVPGTRYFFADMKVRYNLSRLRTEIEAEASNLFNVKSFGNWYMDTNRFFSSEYRLRGRMILLKTNVTF